jgi:hypothetical protein
MLQQQQAMEYAESQMGLLGMKQKAEMTAAGLLPEQAQMEVRYCSDRAEGPGQGSALRQGALGDLQGEPLRLRLPVPGGGLQP